MAQRGKCDSGKEQFWRRMLRLWRRSGPTTVRDFCAEHGLTEPSFYSWRRIIVERDRARRRPPRRADNGRTGAGRKQLDEPAFVPLGVLPATCTPTALELVLGPGRIVRVPPGFDAATLRQLLAVLEEEKPSC
jgi:hypothetical protein